MEITTTFDPDYCKLCVRKLGQAHPCGSCMDAFQTETGIVIRYAQYHTLAWIMKKLAETQESVK